MIFFVIERVKARVDNDSNVPIPVILCTFSFHFRACVELNVFKCIFDLFIHSRLFAAFEYVHWIPLLNI